MIPGSNLLDLALSVIETQDFQLRRFSGAAINAIGVDQITFEDPVTVSGSVQAVPRSLYQHLGLDFKKNYIMIYTSVEIVGTQRDRAGDKVDYNGQVYQAESENDWRPMDGWSGVLCVELTNE